MHVCIAEENLTPTNQLVALNVYVSEASLKCYGHRIQVLKIEFKTRFL